MTRHYKSIELKSFYVNDTHLRHILYAKEFTFQQIEQNWPVDSALTLVDRAYNQILLTILKVEFSSKLDQLIFFTNNPIAKELADSFKSMPIVKNARRLLAEMSLDLGYNLKLMLSEKATHDLMPSLDHMGDLYLDYPYSDPAFYQSYIQNRTYNYHIFGLVITILLFLVYTIKLCCVLPKSQDRGNIIPHIFAMRCGALALYPSYAEYINYCYGFMTSDLPWLNAQFGQKMGNDSDIVPNAYTMFYTNLSMVSTYFLALIAIAVLWFGVALFSYLSESSKPKCESYKSFLYNFFVLGAVMSGCLSLQGVILNPIHSLSANTVFYIVGIVVYVAIFVEIIYAWIVKKHSVLMKAGTVYHDDIGTAGHIRKLRVFVKATLLSFMHVSPLYFLSAIVCF